MPTDVIMPQMGESIFEGTLTKWLKKAGDRVEKDEPLFEISTDKVDAEIPSPVAGVLSEIKVPEGETVEVNTVVAVVIEQGEAVAAHLASGIPVSKSTDPAPKAQLAPPQVAAPKAQLAPPQVAATKAQSAPPQVAEGERIRSSPLVRKIAAEHNLDLSLVAGTGSEGRICKEDVLRHLSEHDVGRAVTRPATPAAPSLAGQVVPLSRMRAIIAERMVESKRISPHLHTVYKVDMTRIVKIREREKAGFERTNGVKLTFMPFVAAAVVEALRKHPIINASLINNAIHYHKNINLGIAVALEWGLIVPVVKEAETLSFLGLARTIADLAERARTKKLKPEEASGSTFTLTNSGVFGDEFSTPIINQPESAILCISGLKKEAVVLTDAEGNDTIAIRSMQHFTLGFDHRTIDGADACRFMLELKKALEGWDKKIG